MDDYHFYHPIEVRYGDLDPQGHVNNAKFLTYFEQARIEYWIKMGFFTKDQSFMEIGVIVADVHLTCEVCHGKKFKEEVLEVQYKGKNVFEVLELSEPDFLFVLWTVRKCISWKNLFEEEYSVPPGYRD